MKIEGVLKIEPVVAEFHVWLDDPVPIAKMKVKVLEHPQGTFLAFANLARRDRATGQREGTSGMGDSVEEALNDLLLRWVADAKEHQPVGGYAEDDFEWSDPDDF